MLWLELLDRSIRAKLSDVLSESQLLLLEERRRRTLRKVRIGASTGFLVEEEDGSYAIEAACGDREVLEKTVFHEFAHWICATLYDSWAHDEDWDRIVSALGYPEEAEREKRLGAARSVQ